MRCRAHPHVPISHTLNISLGRRRNAYDTVIMTGPFCMQDGKDGCSGRTDSLWCLLSSNGRSRREPHVQGSLRDAPPTDRRTHPLDPCVRCMTFPVSRKRRDRHVIARTRPDLRGMRTDICHHQLTKHTGTETVVHTRTE